MTLERCLLEQDRYEYLSEEDSLLYDKVKKSFDSKDIKIKELLEQKADRGRAEHYSCDR